MSVWPPINSSRGDEDRCAICEKGEGIHETPDGRLVCGSCLTKSPAEDVKQLRRERREGRST